MPPRKQRSSCLAVFLTGLALTSLTTPPAADAERPFRVKSGAPADSLVVGDTSDPRVGIGTDTPAATLHIATDEDPEVRLQDTTASTTWDLRLSSGNLELFKPQH